MVSVIIPVYNAKQFVCEALASAVAQMYVQEVLLIDDCSTDGSMEAVQTWLDAHSAQTEDISVRLLKNPENVGVAETRNRGVNEAEGRYVAFLDADDRFADGKLEKQVELLEQTGACLCNTARVLMRPDGTLTQTVMHTPEKITLADLEKTNVINCSSVVARREAMLQFPMEHSEVHEDYLTWLRMLRTYPFAVGINEPLLEYRLSENGKSRNKWKSARMTYRTYRLAGYSVWKSCRMFGSYMVNGLKKYVKC
ncbi:glycosyltransferase family 2 protein [Eubacterium sp. MSJ-21]|nr:glycosyltransferase family 2 protein [Eubacterium sp. MSJ-21]